ncbi:energy transducer TonB [Sphingomonas sp. RS2018]
MIFSVLLGATAIAAAPPQSMQAAFDAATKAANDGRCAEAVAGFDALAASPAAKRNATVAAAIAVRRGQCLITLSRIDEGAASLRAGVDTLAPNPAFREEARAAYLMLTGIDGDRLDYAQGLADARGALALSTGIDRARPLFAVAQFARFDGDGEAVRASAEGLALIQAEPGSSKALIASAQTFAARALMAAGKLEEANTLLRRAMANNGGLTERTSIGDVATRYDMAQSALLRKKPDEAKLYLAYTGAGRAADTPFASAEQIDLPPCGLTPGMTPDSYAVVEFALSEDGRVTRVDPVYAQGDRETALAFARAVRNWSWSPDRAKAIPPFYRTMTRVELRCSTAGGSDTSITMPLDLATDAWLEGKGVAPPLMAKANGVSLGEVRQQAAGSDATAFAALQRLGNLDFGLPERVARAERMVAIAHALGAPQPVRTQAALAVIDARSQPIDSQTGFERDRLRKRVAYQALAATAAVAGDPLSAATVRLLAAEMWRVRKDGSPERDALMAQVAADTALPDSHPLKVRALLALANAAAARDDLDAAAGYFNRTGLTQQQCALIGPRPAVKRNGATSNLYPMDALRMGFGGWVRIEYDIAADGRTAGQRALIAYPPFVFGDAAKAMITQTRFEPSYRPAAGAACSANQQNIVFSVPG